MTHNEYMMDLQKNHRPSAAEYVTIPNSGAGHGFFNNLFHHLNLVSYDGT